MGQLRNPHPGEILKEEFLNEIGVSQNRLAQAIGVPGNRIHAIVKGARDITADSPGGVGTNGVAPVRSPPLWRLELELILC